jgi:hypothetical protein
LFPAILQKLKDCVRHNQYLVTLHADEEMNNDDLSIFDIERAILNGEILERQKNTEPSEWKYIIRGQAIDSSYIIVVAKFGVSGKMVVITIFRDE